MHLRPSPRCPPPALPRPLVAIAADRIERHGHASHAVLHGYVDAVARVAGALPLALPAAPDALDADSLIETIDGLVLTGSPSNVAPQRYGADARPPARCSTPSAMPPCWACCRG